MYIEAETLSFLFRRYKPEDFVWGCGKWKHFMVLKSSVCIELGKKYIATSYLGRHSPSKYY